jgi:hypothetical protein
MADKWCLRLLVAGLIMMTWHMGVTAQVTWQRSEPEQELGLRIFHSTKVIGLPTAESLNKGDFEFEISHRFVPPVKDGYEALYGFDGPAQMRIAVGYAAFENWLITLGRSSIDDNTDFRIKHRFLQYRNETLPILAAIQFGAAWNPVETSYMNPQGNLVIRPRDHEQHVQYFGQMMVDVKPWSRLAVGIVPSFLYNRDIRVEDTENTFMLGTHYQIYLSRRWSLIGEWSFILSDKEDWHNPGGIGVELETGAHIFEMFVTNQVRINPAQHLAGAEYPFDGDNLRIGFFINRIL